MERTGAWPWQDLALVERAMAIATEVHSGVVRKGTTIPYLSHIWSVGALVLEHGGDDAQVAAALLHDTVEDGGGQEMLVSACDKLHNARCILADYRTLGPALWQRFNQTDPAAHAWYYDSLAAKYAEHVPAALDAELRRTVDELLALMRTDNGDLDDHMAAYERTVAADG